MVVRLMAVLRWFCIEPLEVDGCVGGDVDCEGGIACVGVAVDVLVIVDIVLWYDGGARDSAPIPWVSWLRVLDLDLGLDWA
jgi:hypothetical protein